MAGTEIGGGGGIAEASITEMKNFAQKITEESTKIKETVVDITHGADYEVVDTLRVATLATLDTAKEINGAARVLRDRGVGRETGAERIKPEAVDELLNDIREARLATLDTAKEINGAARVLRDRGVGRETIVAVDKTAKAARETAETIGIAAREVGEVAESLQEKLEKWYNFKKHEEDRRQG
jgi:hypothetical protein